MPRYYNITCEYCGAQARKPGNKRPRFCSRKCWIKNARDEISERIGEPLESAILRRYVLERKSYREIAHELGINHRTVLRTLKRMGIEPRKGSAAVITQWENGKRDYQIGEGHYMWRGGASYKMGIAREEWEKIAHKAREEWEKIAHKARERDKHQCTRCGMDNSKSIEIFGSQLNVHHIVPYILSEDNSLNNLRSLCKKCHRTIEVQFAWVL